MSLAPIVIITYSRIDHLKKTIESLKTNSLANQSELFIFIDAPKAGDEKKVNAVKEYAYTIHGFKEIHIKEREKNDRLKNYFDGAGFILKEYKKIIFLEDDNIVSCNFLDFMNDGLEFYKNDRSIMAINGYNVPLEFSDNYKNDYYKSTYFNAWGFATWADRETLKIEKYNGQYTETVKDKDLYKKIKEVHPKLISGLKQIHEGTLDAGDYKLTFHLIKNDCYVVKPMFSYVNNIGHDGSGVNCSVSDRFQNSELNSSRIKFIRNLKYDKNIDKQVYLFFHPKRTLWEKVINKFRKIMSNAG
jgi:hypothetical protein